MKVKFDFSESKKEYYESYLEPIEQIILTLHKHGITLSGCGCCDSPYLCKGYDEAGEKIDLIEYITYYHDTNEGSFEGWGDVKFKVVDED